MFKEIEHLLNEVGVFSAQFKTDLEEMVHEERYKTKQILYAAGQVQLSLLLIKNGFARDYYYDHNGQEYTVRFWKPGDIIFSYEGYYKVQSFYYTEFLDQSEVLVLSYQDLFELQKNHRDVFPLIRHIVLKNRCEDYERQRILTLTANARYKQLLKQNHLIFQKSPVRFIASYLNMSRETLARLMSKR